MNEDNDDIKKKRKKEIDEKELEYYINHNERNYPILLILIVTFTVLFSLGLSFSIVGSLDDKNSINTIMSIIKKDDDSSDKEKYIVTYVENSGSSGENGINLVNQFPTKDEVGKQFQGENYVFNFSLILGKSTKDVEYELTAVANSSNTLPDKYVKLYLEKNGEGVDFSYKENNKVKTFADYKKSSYEETEGILIYKGTITEDDVNNKRIDFVMRMWVSEDAPYTEDIFNKTFQVKVNTYARTSK